MTNETSCIFCSNQIKLEEESTSFKLKTLKRYRLKIDGICPFKVPSYISFAEISSGIQEEKKKNKKFKPDKF